MARVFAKMALILLLILLKNAESKEMTYITASPSSRPTHYSNLAMTPVKQDYYYSKKRFPNGIILPCWHHYIPSSVDQIFDRNKNVKRTWYYADGDLMHLKPVAKYGFYVDPYTKALQVSHRNKLTRESLLFVCVLEEPPDPKSKRGASFYELHEVHIHPEDFEEAQIDPTIQEVLLTFETLAADPFPPGCSHTVLTTEDRHESCLRRVRNKYILPELYDKREGFFIHQIEEDNKIKLVPYVKDTVQSIANLICAKYECEAKIVRSVFPDKGISVMSKSVNRDLDDQAESVVFDAVADDPDTREPWKELEGDLLDSPFSHFRLWSPLLSFRFSSPNMDCEKLKYTFDVTTLAKAEVKERALREWTRISELGVFSEYLSVFQWRKQDKPHSMYYAPAFCADPRTDYRNTFGYGNKQARIYPFRGFTIIWYVDLKQYSSFTGFLYYLRLADLRIELNCHSNKHIHLSVNCKEEECTMVLELKLGSADVTKTTYQLPLYMLTPEVTRKQDSTLVLMLDGPEFVLDSRNRFVRRLRLICDGLSIMTARYLIPGNEDTYLEPYVLSVSTTYFERVWGIEFEARIRVYNWPMYDLISGTTDRRNQAWIMASKPCAKTSKLPPFVPLRAITYPDVITKVLRLPDPKRTFYWSSNLQACISACEEVGKWKKSKEYDSRQYMCDIYKDYSRKKMSCDPFISMPITIDPNDDLKEEQEKGKLTSDKHCPFQRYLLVYAQIFNETSPNIYGRRRVNITQYSDLVCSKDILPSHMSLGCREKTNELEAVTDLVKLEVYPVFQKCETVKLAQGEIQPPPPSPIITHRSCSPGKFMSEIPPKRCEPCPPDTFSDPDTDPADCLHCSPLRNSTHDGQMSSSMHCTNIFRDLERERLVRKFASRSPPETPPSRPPAEDFNSLEYDNVLNETELLDYLSPDPFLLEQQNVAVELFKGITQLTFSDSEVFGMIVISIALAFMITILVFMIGFAGRRTIYRERRVPVLIRAGRRLIQRAWKLCFSIWQLLTKCFHPHPDDRPSWVRKKSLALKSGNVYKIQEALADEKEADYYYQMRIKLTKMLLADRNIPKRAERRKNVNFLRSLYIESKEDIFGVPDYTPIDKIKSSLRK